MNPDALWAEAQPIPLHAIAALLALVLGGLQLVLRKGTRLHVLFGRIWVALMGVVALSSLFIFELRWIGPFSPIHLLSIVTLATLVQGMRTIRRGDVKAHKTAMVALYWQGLLLAGAFTFVPGRTMHAVVFGG